MEKRTTGAMHVVRIVSQHGDREYVSHLLRQSYREGGKVKNRTLANLSALPPPAIDAIRRSLAGEVLVPLGEAFSIERSWPHGQVAAVVGTARKLGLEALVDGRPSRQRDLVLAMVAARVLQPASKLATTRLWSTPVWAPSWGWRRPARPSCTRQWTGSWRAKRASSSGWPSGICSQVGSCSTT